MTHPLSPDRLLDAVVIGGGPAGLTAATYLARYRRNFIVFESDSSRAAWIPRSHNLPGFPDGITGGDMLSRMRDQAERYGARIVADTVQGLRRDDDGCFLVETGSATVRSHMVLLASGCVDREPDLPDPPAATQQGFMRYCPICDAYEVSGQKVAIIGYGACSLREALLLRTYTTDLTLLTLGRPADFSQEDRMRLREANVQILDEPVSSFAMTENGIEAVHVHSGTTHRFDAVYSALGRTVRSDFARQLGAEADADDALIADAHQQTSVPGLYAAGDVVSGLAQVAVATGQAAIAATAIHNQLHPNIAVADTPAPTAL